MRIGIYLAYRPFPKGFSLKSEGLGRYIISLIRSLSESGNEVVIACPNWSLGILEELFDDYQVDIDSFEFVTTKRSPLLLNLYYLKGKGTKKSVLKRYLAELSFKTTEKIIDIAISIKYSITLIVFVLLLFVGGLALLPFIMVFGAICFIINSIEKVLNKLVGIKFERSLIKKSIKKVLKKLVPINSQKKLKNIFSGGELAERFRRNAASELKYFINHMKAPADIWYTPTAFWPEFNDLDAITVTCIPDLVTEEFAANFSRSLGVAENVEILSETIEKGKYFITYCDYIKESLLVDKFGVSPDNVQSILMFVNNMLPEIDVQTSFKYHSDANIRFARERLAELNIYNVNSINPFYFCSDIYYSFESIKYIFYSSQVRHSKNILSLVRAYELLLRNDKISCKLFLTGNYNHMKELKIYIMEHNLQNDVLCFCNVPNQMLAALYACAELSVNPTLYEGGFPFTFSEGVSVGTPSIMSRIPQTEEFVSRWGLEDCLFDPYNLVDISEKILYGLNNREQLLKRQLPLFSAHNERTESGRAGLEYVAAFEYFLALDKRNNSK